MTRVLVVDDETQLRRALGITLKAHGYDVIAAASGTAALEAATQHPPDVVLLDLGLPDLDGVDVITALRGWCTAPIIVLSGRSDSTDKVQALDAGADDYVTKPFGMDELLARLRAATRRGKTGDDVARVRIGDCTIDMAARTVLRHVEGSPDQAVRLTPTEWEVLELLVRNPDRLVTQSQILTQVWGPTAVKESGYLRLYLSQLRRKLELEPSHPRHLVTEPGMGYRFVSNP